MKFRNRKLDPKVLQVVRATAKALWLAEERSPPAERRASHFRGFRQRNLFAVRYFDHFAGRTVEPVTGHNGVWSARARLPFRAARRSGVVA